MGNTMLKFLSLSAALSVALVSFLPEVGFSFPRRVVIINNSPTVIVPPASNYGTVIVNPSRRYRTRIVDPINNSGTEIVNPTFQQPSCGSVIMGSSIPSPVPVNPNTGLSCR